MRRSEIFDNFIKIAEKKGLISDEDVQKKIKRLEDTSSHERRSSKEISELYDVKPKDQDYKKNIMEIAHKDSFVFSPAHDKINGLIENENERQTINLNVLNKKVRGLLNNQKYAEDKLILNLLKLGNSLDNKDQEELAVLSDTCLMQITKKANPLVVAVVAATLVGAFWLHQHLPNVNEGFLNNLKKLVSELDDLINDQAGIALGYSYRPEFIRDMGVFRAELREIYNIYTDKVKIINEIERPKSAKEMYQISLKPEGHEASEAYKALKEKFFNVYVKIKKIIKNFSSADYKSRQIVDKGAITSVVDKMQFLHGGKGLIADDFDDVKNALIPFEESFTNIIKLLESADSLEKQTASELADAANSFEGEVTQSKPQTSNSPSSETSATSPENDDEISSQIADLKKRFPFLA
jgi:hypothetical protein